MVVLTHEGGYGNVDSEAVQEVIARVGAANDRVVLRDLLYDYECLRNVIEGKGTLFRHADGSETRRIKLYER